MIPQRKLIIITGDLASGKSTLADALSKYLNVPAFKKDVIKEQYCDIYGFITREQNRNLSVMAVDFMINSFLSFASMQQNIIMEANFRENELRQIQEMATQFAYDVILIVLRGDIETLYKRFLERLPNRHRAHTSLNLDESIDRFREYIEMLRSQDTVFIPHIIDTSTKTPEEVFETAIKLIG